MGHGAASTLPISIVSVLEEEECMPSCANSEAATCWKMRSSTELRFSFIASSPLWYATWWVQVLEFGVKSLEFRV